jgi:hypothetical protein
MTITVNAGLAAFAGNKYYAAFGTTPAVPKSNATVLPSVWCARRRREARFQFRWGRPAPIGMAARFT